VHTARDGNESLYAGELPTCRATGKVDSRLPLRQKTCDDCSGRARVTLAKRDQILKRSKERDSA